MWDAINQNQENIENFQDVGLNLTNYINLETVSFLEEFDGFKKNIEEQLHDRMMDVRKIIAPVRDQIKKWKHLEDWRHHFVAHPWRDKKGNFIIPDNTKFIVPRNWMEVGILTNLMNYIFQIVKKEFEKEFGEMAIFMHSLEVKERPIDNYETLNNEHRKMADDVYRICKELGKPYHLMINLYILPGEEHAR